MYRASRFGREGWGLDSLGVYHLVIVQWIGLQVPNLTIPVRLWVTRPLWKMKHLRWAGTGFETRVSLNRLGIVPSVFRQLVSTTRPVHDVVIVLAF